MNFLVEKWNRNRNTPEALHELTSDLRKWNKEVFGNLKVRKNKLMARIDGIQVALDNGAADRILELHDSLQEELAILLHQEEMHWFQKSRTKWIECGDRNTKFFHTSTMIRRRRKKNVGLKNEVGEWIDDPPVLKEMVIGYFSNIYTLPADVDPVPVLPRGGFMRLSSNDLMGLSAPFTDIEIWQAMKSMGAYKAPGIDGYQPVFYQKCWETVGASVCTFIQGFFASGHLPRSVNETLIQLIGKVNNPELVTQFRPISLCNVLYKMITKLLAKRLQPLMEKLSSFIPDRSITDNIVLAQEIVHSMKGKKGRKGWFLLKLDLAKAYDTTTKIAFYPVIF
ncbi:hypothetical protein V2J09_021807 [Rumex salicifolius]